MALQSKAFLLTLLSRHFPSSVSRASTFVQTLFTAYLDYPRLRLQYGITLFVLIGIVCGTCHSVGRLREDIYTVVELFEDLKVENKHSIHDRVQRLELTWAVSLEHSRLGTDRIPNLRAAKSGSWKSLPPGTVQVHPRKQDTIATNGLGDH